VDPAYMFATLDGMREDVVEVGSLNVGVCIMGGFVLVWRCEGGFLRLFLGQGRSVLMAEYKTSGRRCVFVVSSRRQRATWAANARPP
jgi:hypothetical protein